MWARAETVEETGSFQETIDDYSELDLEKLLSTVFSASKHYQDIAESPSAVTVITREQIENSFCSTFSCLVRQAPEVDVKQVEPLHSKINARVYTDETRALLLVDGRDVTSEFYGIPVWEGLPVHLEDIERIEIIRGPMSTLYGPNAHSGVFSIITRQPVEDQTHVFVAGGEDGAFNLHLAQDKILGAFKLRLSFDRETRDSYQIRGAQEFSLYRLRSNLTYESDKGRLDLEAGMVAPIGLMSIWTFRFFLSDNINPFARVRYQSEHWTGQIWFNLFRTVYQMHNTINYQSLTLGYFPENFDSLETTLDLELQGNWSFFKGNLLLVGCNYRWLTFQSDENTPDRIGQHRAGLYLQDEQTLAENLFLSLGVRLDVNSLTPLAISPRLAVSWEMLPQQRLRLTASQAFRKPSLANSYLHFQNVREVISGISQFFQRSLGNERLKNESITTFEAGYYGRFLDRHLTIEGDVFYNQYFNSINPYFSLEMGSLNVPDFSKSVFEFRNIGHYLDALGGSLSVTYEIRELLWINANYTYRYMYYAEDPSKIAMIENGKKGDQVKTEPAHLFNLSAHYLWRMGLRLGVGLHGFSSTEQSWSNDGGMFSPKETFFSPANVIVSAFASYRLPSSSVWEIGLRAHNAFNTRYRDLVGVIGSDGNIVGGQQMNREVGLYFRGVW